MSEFEVGDKVCTKFSMFDLRNEFDIGYEGYFPEWSELEKEITGTVTAINTKRKSVTIEVTWHNNGKMSYKPQQLVSTSEAERKYKTMCRNYKDLSTEISQQIAKASLIIKDTAKLIENTEFDCLADFVEECDPLMDALSAGGWSSSSLSC